MQSKVLLAQGTAKRCVEARSQEEAAQLVSDAPRILTMNVHIDLIQAYERSTGRGPTS